MPELTHDEAVAFFAELYRGDHHIPGRHYDGKANVKQHGGGVFKVNHHGGAATFDYDELTRAVFLAHRDALRFWIQPAGRALAFFVCRRDPARQDISHGHPSIEVALEKFRTADGKQWWRFWQDREAPKETP